MTNKEKFDVFTGDRICQLVVQQFVAPEPVWADDLSETTRGEGGFGRSGR